VKPAKIPVKKFISVTKIVSLSNRMHVHAVITTRLFTPFKSTQIQYEIYFVHKHSLDWRCAEMTFLFPFLSHSHRIIPIPTHSHFNTAFPFPFSHNLNSHSHFHSRQRLLVPQNNSHSHGNSMGMGIPWESYGNPMGMGIPIPMHTSSLDKDTEER